jgi:hypothetical protein
MVVEVKSSRTTFQAEHLTVEYLFVEYAERQVAPINDDQGWQCGFMDVPKSDFEAPDSFAVFRDFLLDELNYCAKTCEQFKRKSVQPTDYRFAVVDANGRTTTSTALDAKLMKALRQGARGLMIIGRNMDLHAFQGTDVFRNWFETYVKSRGSSGVHREDYV